MIDKSIRNKRDKLREDSVGLREICLDIHKPLKAKEMLKKQDKIYKKWEFYDKLIKSIERENYEMQDQKSR